MPRTHRLTPMGKYGPLQQAGGWGKIAGGGSSLSAYQQAVVDDGAVALYSMEGSDSLGTDSSGNGNNSDVITDVTLNLTPQVGDGAGNFNDSTSIIHVPGSADFTNIASSSFDFCLECWINIADTAQLRFLCQCANNATTTGGFSMWIDTAGKVNIRQYWTTNSYIFTSTTAVSTGQWVHIAAMIYSDQTADIYIDGTLSADSIIQSGSGSTAVHLTPDLVFGARQYGTAYNMDGAMDEFAIYRNALNQTQVSNHVALGTA